ncbi:MAG TPA: ribonuclease P protein component [Candidatus Baltobacteraceae bacterium]|jgi:ribonuclease P protein component
MRRFASLRRRADFNRLRQRGRRIATPNLTFFRGDAVPADPLPLVGIAVSKAVGTAVVRNRLRRRLAAIVQDSLDGRGCLRLLIVARPAAAATSFAGLRSEVERALR